MARDLKTEALFTEKLAALEARVAKLEAGLVRAEPEFSRRR